MGDQSPRMPGPINSTTTTVPPYRAAFRNQPLVPDHNAAYYVHTDLKPRHMAKDYQPVSDPSAQERTPYNARPNSSDPGKTWDTSRIILLQKQAIDTVEKYPTITKYANAALVYTEKVRNGAILDSWAFCTNYASLNHI